MKTPIIHKFIGGFMILTLLWGAQAAEFTPSRIITLDGPDWKIATDPDNEGRDEKWFEVQRKEAKPTPVPWVIQNIFPGYHGVAWYWREFKAPANPHQNGRYLLRFAWWIIWQKSGSTDNQWVAMRAEKLLLRLM